MDEFVRILVVCYPDREIKVYRNSNATKNQCFSIFFHRYRREAL